MPLSTGVPRAWLRPTNPADEARTGIRGDHRGPYEALNVRGAQAGRTYFYGRNNPNTVLRLMNEGWIPVRSTDPEQWGAELPPDIQESLDTTKPFRDVILFWMPNHKYAALKEAKAAEARAKRTGGENTYLEQGEERTLQAGRAAGGRPLYFQRSHHYIQEE